MHFESLNAKEPFKEFSLLMVFRTLIGNSNELCRFRQLEYSETPWEEFKTARKKTTSAAKYELIVVNIIN